MVASEEDAGVSRDLFEILQQNLDSSGGCNAGACRLTALHQNVILIFRPVDSVCTDFIVNVKDTISDHQNISTVSFG